jgi:hypothetical protein
MDFFGQQARARTRTSVLVLYFVLALLLIVAAVYTASLLILHFVPLGSAAVLPTSGAPPSWRDIQPWDAPLFGTVVVGTLGVVLAGAGYKFMRLARGGSEVQRRPAARIGRLKRQVADVQRLHELVRRAARRVVEEVDTAGRIAPAQRRLTHAGADEMHAFSRDQKVLVAEPDTGRQRDAPPVVDIADRSLHGRRHVAAGPGPGHRHIECHGSRRRVVEPDANKFCVAG